MGNKKTWLGVALLAVLAGVTLFVLLREQSLPALAEALGRVSPGWVVAGLGLMLAFECCEAACTKLILGRLGHRLPYRRCIGYSFVGFYVSSITPSSTGGQPAQIYYMSRDGVPTAHAALNMLLLAVSYQIAALLYCVLTLALQPGLVAAMGTSWGLLLLYGGGVMAVLTVGMLCLMFLPGAAKRLTRWVLGALCALRIVKDRSSAEEKLAHQMAEYRRGAECVRTNPALAAAVLGLTLMQLTALFSVPFAVYRAFGLTGHGAWELIGAQALVTIATSALPLPGAVGASEGAFVRSFAPFFGAALVTPAVLVSRGISFYSFLLLSAAVTLAVHLAKRPHLAGEPKSLDNEGKIGYK